MRYFEPRRARRARGQAAPSISRTAPGAALPGVTGVPSALRGTPARALAHDLGNAAFARLLRAPPTAATAAADVAAAPAGPLAKLRDELDTDVFANSKTCLRYLGELGPGERTLVGRDLDMMGKLAKLFNARDMLQAVELLGVPLKWAIRWLTEATNLWNVERAGLLRLLNGATPDQFDELLGWDAPRIAVQMSWSGDPLSLDPVTSSPARLTGWLGNVGFASWVLSSSGHERLALTVAAADTPARVAALKANGLWTGMLEGLHDGGPSGVAREALHPLFTATTDPEDRRRLYEARFARRAVGPFDWIANGETQWTSEESLGGTGQTAAQVQAAIAAGGPATADAAATADAKGPVALLREELKDFFANGDKCLGLLAQMTDREIYLVCADEAMREALAPCLDTAQAVRAVELLRYLTLKQALAFFSGRSDNDGSASAHLLSLLVARASSQDVMEAIGWSRTLGVMRDAHLDPLALGAFASDDIRLSVVLTTSGGYVDWVVDDGHAARLLRHIAAHGPAAAIGALRTLGRLDDVLDAMPKGLQITPPDQVALRTIFLAVTSVPLKKQLMVKRFDLDKMDTEGGAAEFEAAALDQIWILLEQLPPSLVAGNKWLEAINRFNPSTATPHGETGSNRVALGYQVGTMGAPETGAFTDPGDAMRNTNMFDSNLIHEMGHAGDRAKEFTEDGGPFDTDPDLGAWQKHDDLGDLVTSWATALNLSSTVPAAADREGVIDALTWVVENKKANAEDGFKHEAGSSYGASDDPWQPRWNLVKNHALVAQVQNAQAANAPWMTPPAAIGTRIYHDTGYHYWASYLAATRAAGKLSRYQFRDKRDFFAETYATFYLTPADPGSLVRGWNPRVYQWFLKNVDAGFSTQAPP